MALIQTPQKFPQGTTGAFVINPDRIKDYYSYEYTLILGSISTDMAIGFEYTTSPEPSYLLRAVSLAPITVTIQFVRDRDGYTYTDTVDIRTPIQDGGGYTGLIQTILARYEPELPTAYYTVEQLYQFLTTPDTPTFTLKVFSQGNFNPLFTFLWTDLVNAVEGVGYYMEGSIVFGGITNYFVDGAPFETESVSVSFEDLRDMVERSDLEVLSLAFKLFHYDDRGLRVYDDIKYITLHKDGEIDSDDEKVEKHPHTNPKTDDDYNEKDDTLIDSGDGSGVNLINSVTSTYVLNSTQLYQLKSFLWSADFHDNYLLINNNPIENVIALKTLPFNVAGSGSANIKIGNVDTGIVATKANNSYKFRPISYKIPRKYNNFLDYEPFTSLSIHLPFLHVHDLPTNLLVGHTLKVEYVFDTLTGSCAAILKCDDTAFDYVTGSCAIDMPLTAQNRTQVELEQTRARVNGTANAINASLGAIGGLATGNIGGAISSAVSGTAGAVNSYLDYASATYHSTTKGALGSQLANFISNKCYIIIDRPVYTEPSTYGHDNGYPCELSLTLDSLTGFTQCAHSLELTGLPASTDELNELRRLLTSGVYITKLNIDKYGRDLVDNSDMAFFINNSDVLDTNKDLAQQFVLHGVKWKEDTNALKPTFTIKPPQAWKQTNYCAVKILGKTKFFYIDNIVMRKGGLIDLECTTDVLMTYNSYLRNIHTIVTRQEFKNNKDMVDTKIALPNTREIFTHEIGTIGAPNTSIVLTVSN